MMSVITLLLNLVVTTPLFAEEPQYHSFQSSQVWRDDLTDELVAFASLSDGTGRLLVGCDFRESPDVKVILETKYEMSRDGNLFLFDPGLGTGSNLFGESSKLQIRFDRGEAYSERWNSNGRQAEIARRNKVSFVDSLRSSQRLVMRYYDIEKRPITLGFDSSGISEIIDPVLDLCAREAAGGSREG